MIDGKERKYDLEDRTMKFAMRCRDFVKTLPRSLANHEYSKQLIRSSGSQASNYIEANEAISTKEFCYRIKLCRKETKETCLWLNLVELDRASLNEMEKSILLQEATELRKIFTTIYNKTIPPSL